MIDIFAPFKKKVASDLKEFALKKWEEFREKVEAMAKVVDANDNGIPDKVEITQDLALIKDSVNDYKAGVAEFKKGIDKSKQAFVNLSGLAMAYYLKFGKKAPLIALQEVKDGGDSTAIA